MVNFDYFGPNLPKNGFWERNFENLSPDLESAPPRYHVCHFQAERTTLTFLAQICPKTDFEAELSKIYNRGINILALFENLVQVQIITSKTTQDI